MKNPLKGLDWKLLRKQKNCLQNLVADEELPHEVRELLEGLVNMISAIQDYAASPRLSPENTVFGFTTKEEQND